MKKYYTCHHRKWWRKSKEGKRLKILIPNKLLAWLPISFVQIKPGNNSYKLKHQIRQILYLFH